MKKREKSGRSLIPLALGVVALFAAVQLLHRATAVQRWTVRPAQSCEVGDGVTVSGFAVRQETALPFPQIPTALCCQEGEWVAAGQTLALGFDTEGKAAQERQRQDVVRQLQTLEAAMRTPQKLPQVQVLFAQGALEPEQLRAALLCAESDLTAVQAQAAALQQQAAAMEQPDAIVYLAPQAGRFYSFTDGWESQLNEQALQTMPQLHSPTQIPTALGKLVLSDNWYLVVNLPTEVLKNHIVGERVKAKISSVTMPQRLRIVSIFDESGGNSVLVLQGEGMDEEIARLRRVQLKLEFDVQRGLAVEREALYLLDGVSGVYVLNGARAVWRPVTVIAEDENKYLVSQDEALQSGDLVLTAQFPLYDGKVVDP